jgi:long-chain acyl-CoA synthetase
MHPRDRFRELAAAAPSAPAILRPDGGTLADRASLVAGAERIAASLGPASGPGSLCGLALGNEPAFVAGLLAIWACQRVPVLLGELTDSEQREAIGRLAIPLVLRRGGVVAPTGIPPAAAAAPGAALVKLTSGSSGLPRGVLVSTQNLLEEARILCGAFAISPATRSFAVLPLSHSYGFGNLVLPLLTQGSPFVLGSPFEPRRTLRELADSGAEVLPGVPFLFDLWTRIEDPLPVPPQVRLLLSAGTALAPRIARRFVERFCRRIATFYGTTETGPVAFGPEPEETPDGVLTVGTPMPGVTVALRPGDGAQEAASGRVEVRSAAVALGYLPEPEPGLGGGRFLADDVGRFAADGSLVLIGRESRKIHVAGKKVQPEEVERVLCAVPGVREALVFGARRNESTEEVVALVVAEEAGRAIGAGELREACRARLSPHKVPRRVVSVARIPVTARGKVDVEQARRLAEG